MKLVFIGPPGAGKGTQAQNICDRYSIVHISTGDILRAERKAQTELGKLAQSYIDKGALVPDDVIIGIVENRIAQDDCKNGFLFDGFPRTLEQAKAVDERMQLDVVICLEVADEKLMDRLCGRRVCKACGASYHISRLAGEDAPCEVCGGELMHRTDDQPETIGNRLKVYHEQTSPLIEYYEEKGILHTVDGEKAIDDVFTDICAILDKV